MRLLREACTTPTLVGVDSRIGLNWQPHWRVLRHRGKPDSGSTNRPSHECKDPAGPAV